MKGIFSIVAILLAFSSQVYCDGPFNDLFYNFTGSDMQEYVTIYYLAVSVSINGLKGDVCATGVSNETADSYCRAIIDDIYGVPGFVPVNGTIAYPDNFDFTEVYDYSYTNVSCSNSYTSCTGSQTSNCSASGGLLSIQCSTITPECYPGATALNNSFNMSNGPGLFTVTGHPTICVDGSYLPVCSQVPLSPIDISRICLYSLGMSSGFSGAPAGVMVPPLNLTRDLGRVVTGFECTEFQNCTNTTMYGDCPNDYATVTCQRVCIDDDDNDHDVFLYNQYTGLEGGNTYIAGIPQFCSDGAFTRICNDGTNSPGIINYACNILGYQYGQLLAYNASVYNGTPPGIAYLSNFSCNASGMCGDYANFATNSRCFDGSLDYFIKCYNDTQNCNMPGVSFFTNFTSDNFGQQLLSGIAVMCINGRLVPLCNENDDDYDSDDIDLICTSMGFDGGLIRPPNPSRYGPGPQGVGYYSNFSCPSNVTDTSSCTATMTNNTQCIGGQRELVIECYLGTPSTPSTTATTATPTATVTRITTSATFVITTTGGASSTPSSTPTQSSSSNVGLAVGVTIAVLVVVGLIAAAVIVVVFIVIRKRRSGSFSF